MIIILSPFSENCVGVPSLLRVPSGKMTPAQLFFSRFLPNVAKADKEMGKLRHIRIEALESIAEGQEITIKYIINKLDNPNWEFEYEISQ